ncbi:putative coactivator CBP, KIX domain-containing protein [Rosa chinensis]|uniref:Putative coactivator CBP, KIX domain-containing protein n=1 Tax=Rosa chinensis TaxID=74649 RepID=A0A2P6QLJ8_ROSCH|nr:mediator of RNA polymerase II transcription subunit 15a [Rosa chinensis]PRQ35051.1 putative coactivator CBP, KIX domain-containing protein [Rosa chinensis]
MDNNNGIPPQDGQPSMEAGDWRSRMPTDMRQRLINKIMSTLKAHRPISGQEGLDELEENAVSLEEKIYAAATSQLDYLWKIMLTVVTKPQNTTSNPLESNGKGPLDSVADQGQSVSMSLPANQSQTRQHFVPQNIQNNILPARVQSYAGLSSGLSPTINYQTREQFVPQNIQNSILTAGVQSSVGLSSALSPTGNYHLYGLQPPAPGQNIPGLSYALPPPQGLNKSALLASIPSGFSSAPASIMRPSTLQSSLPRLQQNQQSTIPHSSQSMLQQTAVPQQQMLPQQHQQQQLTGSSTDQQNKKNPSQSIAELLTTIKNSQQQVPMGSIQQTPVSAPQQANMNVQSGINTLHPNVIPLSILQNQQQYQNQLQRQYQIQLLHQQSQQLQLMQMQQINQQLQQQLARQSQTHQMPQLHQIRVVDANMNASSSQSGSNMLQANIVSPLPNSGIVDNQHLKQEQEQKMFKHQPQQPYQQLQIQMPQMLQEKQQQKIQQLEQQAKHQLCHIYFIYLIFLTILMGALIFGIGH